MHRHIGQLVVAGFGGCTVSAELRSLVRDWNLGGVILFGRNIEAPEQVAELAFEIQELAHDVPLWVSVDQEGGRVARLRAPFTEWPPMAGLGGSPPTPVSIEGIKKVKGRMQRLAKFMKRGRIMVRPEVPPNA